MKHGKVRAPEIESFNLADLDVTPLDVRLELSTLIPACTLVICNGNFDCTHNCGLDCNQRCGSNGHGCNVDNS